MTVKDLIEILEKEDQSATVYSFCGGLSCFEEIVCDVEKTEKGIILK